MFTFCNLVLLIAVYVIKQQLRETGITTDDYGKKIWE